jgi:hypothetical protein
MSRDLYLTKRQAQIVESIIVDTIESETDYQSFDWKPIHSIIDPERVTPDGYLS